MGTWRSLVSTEWLAARQRDPNLVILDASVEKIAGTKRAYRAARVAFEQDGHIAGAQFADLVSDFSDPAAPFPFTRPRFGQIEAAAGAIGIGEKSSVVVYDRLNGIWAARLWWLLKASGIENVAVLDGGFMKWRAEGRPASFGPAVAHRAQFRADMRSDRFVDKAEVMAIQTGRAPGLLVCVLRNPVFAGREKVYARAGHIPGSINIPYAQLLDAETNALQPEPILRAALSPALATDSRVVLYCGGGVTAAGGALALSLLGVSDMAVYDGSLNEWSADPDLPLSVEPI